MDQRRATAKSTLIVKPTRHVTSVASLNEGEALEMGSVLHSAASVVSRLLSPDQVYVCLWSHAGGTPGHIHFVVQPVSQQLVAETDMHGPALQMEMFRVGETPDEDAAAAFVAAARDAWT